MSITTEQLILEKGSELVRQNGFNNTSISLIVKAAGIPKGSFYYYFKTKEEFGVKLIEYLHESIKPLFYSILTDSANTSPIERLQDFFSYFRSVFSGEDVLSGCPIGNISQEMAATNPLLREKLTDVFDDITTPISLCLEQAVSQGLLSENSNATEMSNFIVNSWQGALIALKVRNSPEPLIIFEKYIFNEFLNSKTPD